MRAFFCFLVQRFLFDLVTLFLFLLVLRTLFLLRQLRLRPLTFHPLPPLLRRRLTYPFLTRTALKKHFFRLTQNLAFLRQFPSKNLLPLLRTRRFFQDNSMYLLWEKALMQFMRLLLLPRLRFGPKELILLKFLFYLSLHQRLRQRHQRLQRDSGRIR